ITRTMATPATRRRVRFPYPLDKLSKPRLNQLKPEWRNRLTRPCDEAPCGSWSLKSTAHRAGLKVSETKHEMTVDAAIVTANWRKKSPEIPERKAEGTKTAHNVSAVFVPSAFLSGISGLFFRQFAVTIAASTVISCFVSLTLSPALCAVLFRPHDENASARGGAARLLHQGFGAFNHLFERLANGYGNLTRRMLRGLTVVLAVYVGLILLAAFQFSRMSTGFIPEQDQGLLITIVELPPGSSLARTEKVVMQVADIILATGKIEHVAPFAGLDATTLTVSSSGGTVFVGLP